MAVVQGPGQYAHAAIERWKLPSLDVTCLCTRAVPRICSCAIHSAVNCCPGRSCLKVPRGSLPSIYGFQYCVLTHQAGSPYDGTPSHTLQLRRPVQADYTMHDDRGQPMANRAKLETLLLSLCSNVPDRIRCAAGRSGHKSHFLEEPQVPTQAGVLTVLRGRSALARGRHGACTIYIIDSIRS